MADVDDRFQKRIPSSREAARVSEPKFDGNLPIELL